MSHGLILSLCLLTALIGIAAGIYPSLYLSSLKPLRIFRGGNQTGSRSNFTRALVVIQYSIATFFIIATLVFIKQLSYIQGKDLGFDRKNIVVIPTGLWYESKAFKEELLRNPNILGVTATTYAPVDFNWHVRIAVKHPDRIDSVRGSIMWVDEDFAKTYRLQLVKGRFFQMDFEGYWEALKADSSKKVEGGFALPVVINETAEKAFGFINPIGERIGDYMIVGVVKDFHFRPLHYPIGPLVLVNDPQNIMTMNVRITGRNQAETIQFIRDTYQKYRNSRAFSYNYFDDLLARKYQDEVRLRNLTLVFALLAIVISMLGIMGMAVFSCDRRTREIGIRKANGASLFTILSMLNRDFIKWVILAFVIASPVAWYVMRRWLENFAYQTELSWWIFAVAGIFTIVISLLTISWQNWRMASRNPVEMLRYE
jgi:putative ABC transport system permease protein